MEQTIDMNSSNSSNRSCNSSGCELAVSEFFQNFDINDFFQTEINEQFINLLGTISYGTFNSSKTFADDVNFREKIAQIALTKSDYPQNH